MSAAKPETPEDVEVMISSKVDKTVLKKLIVAPDPEHPDKFVRVTCKGWLGRETWKLVNAALKDQDAEWVKEGKNSHWKVPLAGPEPAITPEMVPASTPEAIRVLTLVIAGLKAETEGWSSDLTRLEGRVRAGEQMVTDLERILASLQKTQETEET